MSWFFVNGGIVREVHYAMETIMAHYEDCKEKSGLFVRDRTILAQAL